MNDEQGLRRHLPQPVFAQLVIAGMVVLSSTPQRSWAEPQSNGETEARVTEDADHEVLRSRLSDIELRAESSLKNLGCHNQPRQTE